jgi:UDP-perosamine 4-acetyltransferase
MHKVLIIGAGGHGRVVLDILRAAGREGGTYEPAAFIDAEPARHGQILDGLPILGAANLLPKLRRQGYTAAVVAIGDNAVRVSNAAMARQAGLELANAIHPRATVSPTVRLGVNLCIAAGAVVCAHAQLDDSVIVNTGALVDHECHIHEGVHIAPGAVLAGRVTVEAGAFVGMGCRILPCRRIGRGATVGAGAVVLEDVAPGTTVVGVPARALPL